MKIEIEIPDDLNVSPDMEIFHSGQEGLTTPKYHIAKCIMMSYWIDDKLEDRHFMEISDEFVADLKSFIDKFPSRNLLEDYKKSYGFFNFDHYFKHVSGKFIEYTENYRRAINAKPVLIISESY